jgi:hypothetical protein
MFSIGCFSQAIGSTVWSFGAICFSWGSPKMGRDSHPRALAMPCRTVLLAELEIGCKEKY